MTEEVEKCSLNNIFLENSPNIKDEFKEESCYIDVFETYINANDTEIKDNVWDERIKEYKIISPVDDMKSELSSSEAYDIVINDNVKIENEINPDDIKIESNNKLLFCDHCNEHYEDYCTRCGMIAQILNGIAFSITDDSAIKGIPNNIIEIRESSGHVGVFALKVIPEGVKVGPFNGLSTSECSWRLKGGKFVTPEDKSNMLNWMQYINPARNIFQRNLIPFQCEDNLYYHSNREILVGEELLVYFGEEYEDSVNEDIEMDFVAPTEDDVKDVFACAPCCLGFSSQGYLTKHKSTCPNETNGRFSIDGITQCPFCNIYLYQKEYFECHRPYCCERNIRKSIPLRLDDQTVEVNRRKTRLQMYKCPQCKYKTTYKSVLRSHLNKHCEVKMYRCEMCPRQFKTRGSLKLHVKYKHNDVEEKDDQTRSVGEYMQANTKARSSEVYQTKYKNYLETHIKTKHFKKICCDCGVSGHKTNCEEHLEKHTKSKHLKEFSYECEICGYKTNDSSNLKRHIKAMHLKEFSYDCEICDYKTNHKPRLEKHIKSIHLKQFIYECEICDYKTNHKHSLETHVKSKHLKEFRHECVICDYKTNHKPSLDKHVKTIHLKEFSYECEICDYKTNEKSHFETHVKSKHLKEFSYECETCDYKTNKKPDLEMHIKVKHLKEFTYGCEICGYKTNRKSYLERHVKSKHLKQFSYECEICSYKTNHKQTLERHIKSKHLKQFSYECEICGYKTNHKQGLETHIKSIHLKEFSHKCEICSYKTSRNSNLEAHVKTKHVKEFSYECDKCDYKTNHTPHLERHIKAIHLKELSYKCDKCAYKSNQKSNLNKHIRSIHLKQFSFECGICNYKTNQKQALEKHIKSKHP